MSAEKAKFTYSSAARRSQGIFTLSNVFFNNSSRSPGVVSHISFERNGFTTPIVPVSAISCFRNSAQPATRSARSRNRNRGSRAQKEESEPEAAEAPPAPEADFDSELQSFSLESGSSVHGLQFIAKPFVASPGQLVLLKHVVRIGENFPGASAHKKKRYVCKYCGDVFATGCAMGGHISKVHRGCSREYRKKRLKSRAKKNERERARFLRRAFSSKFTGPFAADQPKPD